MKIKSVAILGAGAVGSYLIWGLSKKEDVELCVVAEGERKSRFERDGFCINGRVYHPVIKTPREAAGADLVILSVKYSGLPSAMDAIREIVAPHTLVMSLMNGIDSEEKLGTVIPPTQILPSLIKINSERRGNSIHFDPEPTIGIIFGEAEEFNGINGKDSPERTEAVAELLHDTGIHWIETEDIIREIWSKFQLNVSWNIPQAIIGAPLGCYTDSQHALWLMQALSGEVSAVAAAKGISLPREQSTDIVGKIVTKKGKYSMLQDMEAGRHTEIDMFCGTMIRMGEELGIPVPASEMAYHLIRALEEKMDGNFIYE
ncbi:MAG: 2-dehydropantoate 2-reductase [Lachnospiraceae bacterium]|nr:2-dehydropantoate 2-reductase [Lachnospiraceae bacterium]